MNEKRVVITGIGPLSSLGRGRCAMWDALVAGRPRIRRERVVMGDTPWRDFPLHRIEDFRIEDFAIDTGKLAAIERWKEGEQCTDLLYLLAVAKLALDDSALGYDPRDNAIGCVVVHENPGLEQYFTKLIDLSYDASGTDRARKVDFAQHLHDRSIKSAYELQPFMVLFHVMRTFDLHGYSQFVNNACSSGLHAFETAGQMIRSGRCPAVLVAGADYPRVYKYLWFKQLGMYEEDGLMKPFDRKARGLVFGDGGAGFILEEFEHARRRGATIYAELLGAGFSQEAWKVVLPDVAGKHYRKAIEEALHFARCSPDEIDVICAHGAGHSLIDRHEANTFSSVWRSPPTPPVTAFKPFVGHNLGGNTLLDTAILLMCMEHDTLLPVLNTDTVHPRIAIDLVRSPRHLKIDRAIKTCCAFAGYNAAAVFGAVNER